MDIGQADHISHIHFDHEAGESSVELVVWRVTLVPWIATDCLVVIAKEVLRLLVIAGRLVVVVCLRETSTGFEILLIMIQIYNILFLIAFVYCLLNLF